MVSNVTNIELYYNDSLLQELNNSRMHYNIPVIIYLFIVMLVSFLGNLLVMIIYSFYSPKTPSNHYILVLALVDLISSCICVPFQINVMWNPYINAMPMFCQIERFVENSVNLASGFILVSIASERYMKICYPLEPYELSRAKRISFVNFFLSVSLAWPQIPLSDKHSVKIGKYGVAGEECHYVDSPKGSIYVFLFHGLLYCVYILAFGILIYFYIRILVVVIRIKSQLKPKLESNKSSTRSKHVDKSSLNKYRSVNGIKMRSSRTTMCLTTVTFTGMLSYIPFLTIMTLRSSGLYLQSTVTPSGEFYFYGTSPTVDKVCRIFTKSYFLNGALNPIIYSVINPNFRTKVGMALKQARTKISKLFSYNPE